MKNCLSVSQESAGRFATWRVKRVVYFAEILEPLNYQIIDDVTEQYLDKCHLVKHAIQTNCTILKNCSQNLNEYLLFLIGIRDVECISILGLPYQSTSERVT